MGYRLAAYDETARTPGLPEMFKTQAEYDDLRLAAGGSADHRGFELCVVGRPPLAQVPDSRAAGAGFLHHLDDLARDRRALPLDGALPAPPPRFRSDLSPLSRAVAQENKWRAQRYGIHGLLRRRGASHTTVSIAYLVQETVAMLEEDAETLGCSDDLARCLDICARGHQRRRVSSWCGSPPSASPRRRMMR